MRTRVERVTGASTILCALLLLAWGPGAQARNTGMDTAGMPNWTAPKDTASCNGAACHPAASSDVRVDFISGPDVLARGETADYTIEMTEAVTGGLDGYLGAGFSVAAYMGEILQVLDDGVLDSVQANVQVTAGISPLLSTGQLTHQVANPDAAGVWSYTFSVTAPMQDGDLTLEAGMNAFLGNFTVAKWSTATKIITIPEPASLLTQLAALGTVAVLARRRRVRAGGLPRRS